MVNPRVASSRPSCQSVLDCVSFVYCFGFHCATIHGLIDLTSHWHPFLDEVPSKETFKPLHMFVLKNLDAFGQKHVFYVFFWFPVKKMAFP